MPFANLFFGAMMPRIAPGASPLDPPQPGFFVVHATGVLMLITQTLKDALRCVPLLLENVPVVLQDLMNDANEGTQLRRYRSVFTLVAGWHRVIDHLGNGLAADAELLGCSALAHGIRHSQFIQFNCATTCCTN
jgi:hypothetical protein